MGKIYRSSDRRLPKEIRRGFSDFIGQKIIRPFDFKFTAECQTKAFDPSEEMIVEGIANLAEPDRIGEIIDADAWNIEKFLKNPIMLYEHRRENVIGKALDVSVKKDGLYYRAQIGNPKLAPLTSTQMDVRSLLAQGILRTNSVGFIPHLIEYDEDNDVLRYTDVELLEISIVAIPMQQDSVITAVKSWKKGKVMATDQSQVDKKAGGKDADGDDDGDQSEHAAVMKAIGECKEYAKGAHEMLTKMSDKKALEDEIAALKASNETLATENTALKAQVEDLNQKGLKLLESLKKLGHVKPSAA